MNMNINIYRENESKILDFLKSTDSTISKEEFIRQLRNIISIKDEKSLSKFWEMYQEAVYEERINSERSKRLKDILTD